MLAGADSRMTWKSNASRNLARMTIGELIGVILWYDVAWCLAVLDRADQIEIIRRGNSAMASWTLAVGGVLS